MPTLGETKAQILRDLKRSDISADTDATLTESSIEFYIKSAIDYYKHIPFFFNEATTTMTSTAADKFLDSTNGFPTDFIADIKLDLDEHATAVRKRPLKFLLERDRGTTSTQGEPRYYCMFETNKMRLYPEPDQVYTFTFYYVKELPELTADSATNAWLTDGGRLIRAKATADLYLFTLHNEQRAANFTQIANDEEGRLLARSQAVQNSGFYYTNELE